MKNNHFWEFVVRNVDKPWDWNALSRRKDGVLEALTKWPNLPWKWCEFNGEWITQSLVEKYHSSPWNWKMLSRLSWIAIDYVLAHPNYDWNWSSLSQSPAITFNDIMTHSSCPWEWNFVSINPNLTLNDVISNRHLNWNWGVISSRSFITCEVMNDHPEIPFNYTKNKNLTREFILTHIDEMRRKDILHDIIAPFDVMCDFPNENWNWIHYCSFRKEICLYLDSFNNIDELKTSNIYRHLKWRELSRNIYLTPCIIKKYFDNWCYLNLSHNMCVSCEFMLKHNNHYWNWNFLSSKYDLTIDIILKYPEIPWVWDYLSTCSIISWEDIISHPEFPWHIKNVSINRNITPAIVEANPNFKWDWKLLSSNCMDQPYYNTNNWKQKLATRVALIIFNELIAATCRPDRHPTNWMAIDELVDHPLRDFTASEIKEMYVKNNVSSNTKID